LLNGVTAYLSAVEREMIPLSTILDQAAVLS